MPVDAWAAEADGRPLHAHSRACDVHVAVTGLRPWDQNPVVGPGATLRVTCKPVVHFQEAFCGEARKQGNQGSFTRCMAAWGTAQAKSVYSGCENAGWCMRGSIAYTGTQLGSTDMSPPFTRVTLDTRNSIELLLTARLSSFTCRYHCSQTHSSSRRRGPQHCVASTVVLVTSAIRRCMGTGPLSRQAAPKRQEQQADKPQPCSLT